MLRDNDVQVDIGRASHGGDFMRLRHIPTGMSRCHPGPMKGIDTRGLVKKWCDEIEAELKEKGLLQYLSADTSDGKQPDDPRSDCFTYFRQAIESPALVVPWHEWWQLHSDRVKQVFSR